MIGIDADQMDTVFPFHLVFDGALKLLQAGAVIRRMIPELEPGVALMSIFSIVSPKVEADFDALAEQSYTIFFLRTSQMTLRGQFMLDSSGIRLLFIGTPVIKDMSEVMMLGLSINDFARYDSILDLLLILQSKSNVIDDTKRMADQLRKEVNERREAQQELEKSNLELEQRVEQRTQALQALNNDMQLTIRQLERHNRQVRLLNSMGDMLQACRSVAETYDVIKLTLKQLFEGSSGLMALCDAGNQGVYTTSLVWGRVEDAGQPFKTEQCWALRRTKLQIGSNGASPNCYCNHLDEMDNRYACIPLNVQGELLGVIHVLWDHAGEKKPLNLDVGGEYAQLLQTASDHIALAIANIRLQETLRIQSIRDALTGLYNRRHMEEALKREISRAQRNHLSLGVILMDVDHFKKFNDSYGHDAGDDLLRELGSFLERHIRGDDIACRYGGEEFILILPGASIEQSYMRAHEICQEASKNLYIHYNEQRLGPVTLSMGVSVFPQCGGDPSSLIKSADAALYEAKHSGRNRAFVASNSGYHPSVQLETK